MNNSSKIYIAGHKGMVGSAILRNLKARGYANLICRTHSELDLTRQDQVETFFKKANRIVIIPDPKKEIPKGTFASILRQSGLDKDDFR